MLSHEVAHSVIEDDRQHKSKEELIKLEGEADENAFESIVEGISNDQDKLTIGAGTLIGLASLFMLQENISHGGHPPADDRLKSFIELLGVSDRNEFWAIPCFAYAVHGEIYNKKLDSGDREGTYKDLFDRFYQQLRI